MRKLKGYDPKPYDDMRRMFESKEIDAVSITTPNHWHALSTIWACQAGKDVYIEKPASHNIFESRQDGGRRRAQVQADGAGGVRRAAASPTR